MKAKLNYISLLVIVFAFILYSCKKGNELENLHPNTKIYVDSINRTGQNRLQTTVYLSWHGTDVDGYIQYYEYSFDGTLWFKTLRQDSVFKFAINANSDTSDVLFKIRAIDNQNYKDETPAELIIPIRNSNPNVNFEDLSNTKDTVQNVFTFKWFYNDKDGNNTVTQAYLKCNNGNWVKIDKSKIILSIMPINTTQSGTINANIFYDNLETPDSKTLDGFVNNANNTFYLKVEDQSGGISKVDTSKAIFFKKQTSDLLVIGGQPDQVNSKYYEIIKKVYPNFDYIDYYKQAGINQPKYWNPTFALLLSKYAKVFLNSDQSTFTQTGSGINASLLEFASIGMQKFTNKGGKSLITSSFLNKADVSNIRGFYPIDSISKSNGQAIISNDSIIKSNQVGFPNLKPSNLLLGADPFVSTPDAEMIYFANLTPLSGWSGPRGVGALRKENGKWKQVFFSIELHYFDADKSSLELLFSKILTQEFNW